MTDKRKAAAANYTADDFSTLEGLEAVIRRPGMYIGSTSSAGLMHLAFEVFDNSVDEAIAGYCTNIWVILRPDGSVEVSDNGRGIPVDISSKSQRSGVLMAFTSLHSGGKFGGKGYKASGGLHGVGAAVVTALSTRVDVTVYRDETHYRLGFLGGSGTPVLYAGDEADAKYKPVSDVVKVGKAPKGRHGTTVRFWPNTALFTADAAMDRKTLLERARKTAFLVPGLTIDFRDLRDEKHPHTESFRYDGGVKDMVDFLTPGKPLCDIVTLSGAGTFVENVPVLNDKGHMVNRDVERTVEVSVAFRWDNGYDANIHSFVNVITTPNGGTHVKGFERALLAGIRKGYEGTRLMKANEEPPILDDLTEGLTAVISVAVPEPQFEGQTKEALGTAAVAKIVQDVVAAGVKAWLESSKTKNQARLVLEKVANAARNRVASRTQREAARRKTALEGASMPAKLVDCRAIGVDRSEVFIVEGDSALGCFTGDTLVATAEGRPLTFAQLTEDWANGITHFGYTTNKNGDVNVVPLIEPRISKRGAALVAVTLDNDEVVRCTPDHLFRLRDGSYRRADQLAAGDSLMPLYRQFSAKSAGDKLNGYEKVWMNTRQQWVYTHYLADAWNTRHGRDTAENGNTRHHIDFNRLNNHPDNIKRMTHEDHFALHVECMDLDKLMAAYQQWLDNGGREVHSQRMRKQWEDPEFALLCGRLSADRHTQEWFREALHGGFQRWYTALSDEEKEQYADRMRARQAAYWASPEARAAAAARTTAYFSDPAKRAEWSARSIEQWDNEELRAWRSRESIKQFSDPAERERQSRAVYAWREENPEWVAWHAARTAARMADDSNGHKAAMKAGRDAYHARTPRAEFVALQNQGRVEKALRKIRDLLVQEPRERVAEVYEANRLAARSTSLRFARLVEQYGDESKVLEAAEHLNHAVVSVEALAETADVYDLTVEGYHNFALEAGVFVHNSARQGRNSEYQALLPIRGKILNVQKASLADMLKNAECSAIIQCIGAGSGKTFDIEQMRYGRVMLMADADVDGSHIRVLLLTLFYRYMRPVIEEGRMYAAMPPLHKIEVAGKGGETIYTYTHEEMERTVAKLEKAGKKVKQPIQRYKGLGEMNAEELWETTMDPARRSVRRITLADAAEAERMLELLMGNEVEPRKNHIINSANRVDRTAIDV